MTADGRPYATVPVADIIAAAMADIEGRPPFNPWVVKRRKPRRKARRLSKLATVPVAPMLDAFLKSIGIV